MWQICADPVSIFAGHPRRQRRRGRAAFD